MSPVPVLPGLPDNRLEQIQVMFSYSQVTQSSRKLPLGFSGRLAVAVRTPFHLADKPASRTLARKVWTDRAFAFVQSLP